MPEIPLGKADSRRTGNFPVRLTNLVFEQDPTNTKDQVSLIARPGLALWADQAFTVPVRGLFTTPLALNNVVLGVCGSNFFGYTVGGSVLAGASGTIDGIGSASFASIDNSASIKMAVTGGLTLYQYQFGLGLSVISFPDSASVISIDALASRVIAVRFGTQQFYWSAPNALTFDALDYASAETATDNLVACKVQGDELWLFGGKSIEVWVPSTDPDLPFQRITGRSFGIGLLTRASLARIADTIFFVGAEERKVFRISPNPVRISDPALEARLALADPTAINALAADVDGHVYYVLNMGAQGSMAYDVTTGQWSEWTSYGATDFQARYSTPLGDGRYLVGDTVGDLHILNPLSYTDNGVAIQRRVTGLLDAPPRTRVDNLILECTVGQAPTYPENPVVVMQSSDDMGKTWTDPDTASLGHQGDFSTYPMWRGLGGIRDRDGRLFWISCSENLPLTIHTLSTGERP